LRVHLQVIDIFGIILSIPTACIRFSTRRKRGALVAGEVKPRLFNVVQQVFKFRVRVWGHLPVPVIFKGELSISRSLLSSVNRFISGSNFVRGTTHDTPGGNCRFRHTETSEVA